MLNRPSAKPDDLREMSLADAQTPALEAMDVLHRYGGVTAVNHVSMTAERGEFVTLLGESGSGKTTLLRIIAGLEQPTSIERIAIGGIDVLEVPASGRNVTTVFQHYALFPHMSVGENVEYGLRVRRVPSDERRQRAHEALELVRLTGKFDRRVHQLSGGERQRVALARALVTKPTVLLLDEPLAALDAKLRAEMQIELKQLHERLGTTFVYITHSQDEALALSDRIILMRSGRIVQEGSPRDLLDQPISRFVADFMGIDNLIDGTLVGRDSDWAHVEIGGSVVRGRWCGREAAAEGGRVCVAIRAEHLNLHSAGTAPDAVTSNVLQCRQVVAIELGRFQQFAIDCPIGSLTARIWNGGAAPGPFKCVSWRPQDCSVTVPGT